MKKRLFLSITLLIVLLTFVYSMSKNDSVDTDMVPLEKIPQRYDYLAAREDAAINDNYIVFDNFGNEYNYDHITKFIEDVSNGKKGKIRIVRYTVEGDPLIIDLEYNGKYVTCVQDYTRDKFASPEYRFFKQTEYIKGKRDEITQKLIKYLKSYGKYNG